MIYVTTSWDDGHKLDIKLAELLDKYGLKGTFYISKNYFKEERLSEEEILSLSRNHEIGAHTINHLDLTNIPAEDAKKEIQQSKNWLEDVLEKEVSMFCYPYGKYNNHIKTTVKESGFKGARTTKRFSTEINDPHEIGFSLHVYPFPFRKMTANRYYWRYLFQPLEQNWEGIRKFNISFHALRNWLGFASALFENLKNDDSIFHIYGHSWEIDKYGMWDDLERFFAFVVNDKNVTYATNSQLISIHENFNLTG
ncbi:MAG: hypothetical protein COV30_01365 [Candidatus Yanofskybacteria bacterium CG10_big_fil_rev_8_21_14_0_10_37_15]|uniref:NodB homology domain-containing protein n=1 Tax=Candidatus Yanofskybacteria bacterium CG10_big_fil_rev_8_21_14_0_10_37_15 TaxID=1975097 RepID=A0A2H0R5P8_9BACT|nr:MAG: hypothetical protein COV30_01365 [Candidatus Yanofskybacteria bacterium CG10_big_fil_rev_8_21_14_0_10_37_15]